VTRITRFVSEAYVTLDIVVVLVLQRHLEREMAPEAPCHFAGLCRRLKLGSHFTRSTPG